MNVLEKIIDRVATGVGIQIELDYYILLLGDDQLRVSKDGTRARWRTRWMNQWHDAEDKIDQFFKVK